MDKKYIEYYGLMLYKFENLLYDNDNGSLMDYMSTFFDHVFIFVYEDRISIEVRHPDGHVIEI